MAFVLTSVGKSMKSNKTDLHLAQLHREYFIPAEMYEKIWNKKI